MSQDNSLTEKNWEAFEYEVRMFYATRWRRATGPPDLIVRNVLVESELLHIRILSEALLDKGQHQDDISLQNLLPVDGRSAELVRALEELSSRYGGPRDETAPCWELNKRLAHLTRERGQEYNYGSLFAAMEPLLDKVLCLLAPLTGRAKLMGYIRNWSEGSAEDA